MIFLQHLWESCEKLLRKCVRRMDSGLGLAGSTQQKGHGERKGGSAEDSVVWPLVGTRLAGRERGLARAQRLVIARR